MRDTGTWRAMEELYEQGLVKAGKAFCLRFFPKHQSLSLAWKHHFLFQLPSLSILCPILSSPFTLPIV